MPTGIYKRKQISEERRKKLVEHAKKLSISNIGRKLPQISGEKHGQWKGENVGYSGLHWWIRKQKGSAKICSKCGSTNTVQWANKSHKYKRDLDDWIELCWKCHLKYDKENNAWGLATKKFVKM